MANLTTKDKIYLEKLFQMGGGYVLDFSDRTMGEFFRDNLNIEIYQEAYNYASGSKANYMRGFWNTANDQLVGKSIAALIEYIQSKIMLDELKEEDFKPALIEECRKISLRLTGDETNGSLVASQAQLEAFLKQDFEDVSASVKNLEADIQGVIQQRLDEVSAILAKAPLAAIFLIGSTLEGILLDTAKSHAALFTRANAAPKYNGTVINLEDWKLNDLINVAYEVGFVTKNVKDFSHSLRTFRNYIHPRAQANARFNPNGDTAKICFQVLKAAITELTTATKNSQPATSANR